METKTFLFIEKNGSGVLTFSAYSYDEALEQLHDAVRDPFVWRCENEDGEDEDE